MVSAIKLIAPLSIALLTLTGCQTVGQQPPVGTLNGVLRLQWTKEDGFIYTPDDKEPLTYVRQGKAPLTPQRMLTDGGSIPRVFWSAKGFSPWSYGPAYVLHDWVYLQHQCRSEPGTDDSYTFNEANELLSDVLNILVAEGKADGNGEARRLIRWAVDNFGQQAWNGPCSPAPIRRFRSAPITIQEFRF